MHHSSRSEINRVGEALPTIDALIPAFNVERTIRQSIESLQRQTVSCQRIIVVNDGSTDATAEILRDLASRDRRIEIVDQPNKGIVEALNLGLSLCSADYVARLDGDDIAFPERIAVQAAYLRANGDVAAVSSQASIIDSDGVLTGELTAPTPLRSDCDTAPSQEPQLLHPFLMFRRTLGLKVGGYRLVHHAEDIDLYWRLQQHGRLVDLPEVLGHYRKHPASVSNKSIVNGRVAAVNSQLSALSARRRRSGRPDLDFAAAPLPAYVQAARFDRILDVANTLRLDESERRHLSVSASAKLLTEAFHRPYELDVSDCWFVRKRLLDSTPLPPGNRQHLVAILTSSVRRLLGQGLFKEAAALTPFTLYPRIVAQLLRSRLMGR